MKVESVSSPSLPMVKMVTAKSSMLMVTASMNPETMPGRISGMMIFLRACMGVAPRSSAAS